MERLNNFEHPWGQNILTWWVKCPGVAFREILMHTLTTSTPLRGGVCTAELFVGKKKKNNSAPSTSFSERRFPFHQVWFFFFANWSGDRMVSFKFEFDNCNTNFSVVLRLRTTDKLHHQIRELVLIWSNSETMILISRPSSPQCFQTDGELKSEGLGQWFVHKNTQRFIL